MLSRLKSDDRGAAAVEFALILVALVPLILGVLEMGRALSTYITITTAAREAARQMIISSSQSSATTAGLNSAPGLSPALASGNFTYSAATCTAGTEMTVTVKYSAPTLTNFFGATFPMQVTGAMRCAG